MCIRDSPDRVHHITTRASGAQTAPICEATYSVCPARLTPGLAESPSPTVPVVPRPRLRIASVRSWLVPITSPH
eukprot:4904544-Prymnesium_polylepis.1